MSNEVYSTGISFWNRKFYLEAEKYFLLAWQQGDIRAARYLGELALLKADYNNAILYWAAVLLQCKDDYLIWQKLCLSVNKSGLKDVEQIATYNMLYTKREELIILVKFLEKDKMWRILPYYEKKLRENGDEGIRDIYKEAMMAKHYEAALSDLTVKLKIILSARIAVSGITDNMPNLYREVAEKQDDTNLPLFRKQVYDKIHIWKKIIARGKENA